MFEVRSLKPETRSGMILLVVIVIVALLSLAGYAFMALMNSELNSARQRGRDIQVQYISQSGISLVESVATLSQNERQWAGGTFDNPTLFCAASIDGDLFHSDSSPRLTVVAPKLDNGRMAGIRYGLINESSKLNLAKVLEWETANPGDGVNALRRLPGMTVQIAESILDWIDADDQQRPGGAEAAWYAQQRLPYRPRNAVPVTLEEFLLVRGVTRQLMFGDDENFNFVPDSQEARMSQSSAGMFSSQTAVGTSATTASPGIPWCHLLTVVSAERDANPRGMARIDLNDANLSSLHAQLTQRINRDVADFIILYRQYGTEELANQAAATDSASETSPRGTRGAQVRASRRNARQSAAATTTDDAPGDVVSDVLPDDLPPPLDVGGVSIAPLPGELPGDMPDMNTMLPPDPSALALPEPPPPLTIDVPSSDPAPPLASQKASDFGIQASGGEPTQSQAQQDQASQGRRSNQDQTLQGRAGGRQSGSGRSSQGRGGARNALASRFSDYVDLQTPAKYRLETPLDIVGVTVVIPQQDASAQSSVPTPEIPVVPATTSSSTTIITSTITITSTISSTTLPTAAVPTEPAGIRLDSPLMVNASSLNSTLVTYLDETSTAASTTIVGRINLNEAPYEVVAGIPGLSQNAAQSIVSRREQQANGMRELYRQPTWLLAYNVVDLATLKKIWPHVTCGGDVLRGQVISFYEDIGTFSRVDVALDATVFPPRLIDSKDLTSHGIGFHDRVLFGNIPQQGQLGGAAGSTAPSLADRSTGGSLTDSFSGMAMPPMQQMPQQPFMQPTYGDIPPPLEISTQ